MWTIRQEQVDAFRQAALQQFEDEMVAHLSDFTPKHWQVMGEPDGRKVIQLGIQRAKEYGFTNRGPVRFYIELMFMFGSYFDTDPQYPWTRNLVEDIPLLDQMDRADRLYDAMNEYAAQVSGPDQEYLLAAMHRLRHERIQDVILDGNLPLEDKVLRRFEQIYPQKCAYLGEPVLRFLIQHGFRLAVRYNMVTDKAMVLMAALTLAAGHGFPVDPLYSCIGRTLDDKRWPNPNDRAEELYSQAIIYLKQTLPEDGKKK